MGFLDLFVDALHLNDADLASLKEKRGLHEATINKLKFKSCGLYIRDVINSFDQKDLIKHRIVDNNGNVNKQLLRNNILIPYIKNNNTIEKIRPHKLGFSGDPVQIYSELIFDHEQDYVVLTEGEFKAAAGFQYKINTIAVPGISSFIKAKFQDFYSFIKTSKNLKKVIILFDKEVKDNPELPNFKQDWKSRYDVQIYSCAMAKKLIRYGVQCTIAEFPSEWMVNGKIDLDGCLANGISKSQMDDVINNAMSADSYFRKTTKDLGFKEFHYIKNRIHKAEKERSIDRKDNKYWFIDKKKSKDDEEDDKPPVPITNFVMDIMATYHDVFEDGLRREIVLTDEYGTKTKPKILGPEFMTSVMAFKKFLYSVGNYMFYGNDASLMSIWEWEFDCDDGKHIYEIDHIGKMDKIEDIAEKDIWVTRDIMFYGDTEIYADDNNIFWTDGFGFKFAILDNMAENAGISTCKVPLLSTEEIDIGLVIKHFSAVMGEGGKLLIGWLLNCLLATYYKTPRHSPFPFVYGEKQTGKTTLCSGIMALFGLPDYGTTFTDITTPAINRLMAYYSGFPLWIDEFSNDPKTAAKEPHLKSVYDKTPVMKGTRKQFGIASYPVRSNLIISGETTPIADAVKSRSILLPMRMNYAAKSSVKWIEDNKNKLSYIAYYVLKNRHRLAKECEEKIDEYYEAITRTVKNCDIRTTKHYATMAGCYRVIAGKKDDEFNSWVMSSVIVQRDTIKEDEIHQFLEDMSVLYADGKINDEYFKLDSHNEKTIIILWLKGIYDKWKDMYGRNKEIHAFQVIKDSIKNRPYFIKEARIRIGNHIKRTFIFDYNEAPEVLKDFMCGTASQFTLKTCFNNFDTDV